MNKKYKLMLRCLVLLISFLAAGQINAAGEVDSNFNAQAYRGLDASISKLIRQPDGKILIGGNFRVVNGVEKCTVVRLNADRTVDNSFTPPEFFFNETPCQGYLRSLALQPDGKIIVVGSFFGTDGNIFPGIRRLNADGSLDTSFNTYANLFTSGNGGGSVVDITFVEVQSDGKIFISGNFSLANQNASYIARLNSDGTVDNSFVLNPGSTTARFLKLQPDGKVFIIDNGTIKRLNTDGSVDNTFQNLTVNAGTPSVTIDSTGKIYLTGIFTTINGFNTGNIVRFNADGSFDTTFNSSNINGSPGELKIDSNGKLLLVGSFSLFNGTPRNSIVRLNADGTVDNSLTSPFAQPVSVFKVLPLPDGKILLGGTGINTKSLYLLNSDGSFDNSFNVIAGSSGIVRRILQQTDGKILVAGNFRYVNENSPKIGVARFNADGTVDETFTQTTELDVKNMDVQSDGKILICSGTRLLRLNSDGTIDSGFTISNGSINRVKALPDGKILIGGIISASDILMQRLKSDGTVDNTFAQVRGRINSSDTVYDFEVQPDGKIVIGGLFTQVNGSTRGNFARLNSDGTLDTNFAPPFGTNGSVYEVELQSTGKVILGGVFTGINGNTTYKGVGRVNSDGTLDTGFSPVFITVPIQSDPLEYAIAVKVQPDDKILLTDRAFPGTYRVGYKLIRLFPNGAVDNTFIATTNLHIADVQLQSDGKILLGGDFTRVNGVFKTDIARLLNQVAPQGRARFDYDGDGRADVSVFRPSNGVWYLNQSTNGFAGVQFGTSSDLLAPADFDGDGKTDIAVFRPSNGVWYYLRSSDNGFSAVQFGQNGDVPIPGDFDGDNKADINVFRPSNGVWYRLNSSNGAFVANAFGQNGDIPLQGDFNGDGKADLAVFRPSNGYWYIAKTTGTPGQNFDAIPFGIASDIPTPADYDGDGKTDISVFRASNGNWYRLNSSDGAAITQAFGQSGDIPAAADYDGDGKANLAVFRPAMGSWYIARPTGAPAQNFDTVQFGVSTDKPTPAAFQR